MLPVTRVVPLLTSPAPQRIVPGPLCGRGGQDPFRGTAHQLPKAVTRQTCPDPPLRAVGPAIAQPPFPWACPLPAAIV